MCWRWAALTQVPAVEPAAAMEPMCSTRAAPGAVAASSALQVEQEAKLERDFAVCTRRPKELASDRGTCLGEGKVAGEPRLSIEAAGEWRDVAASQGPHWGVPRRASARVAAIPDRAVPVFEATADPPLVEVTTEDVVERNCADTRALLLEAVAPCKPIEECDALCHEPEPGVTKTRPYLA